MTFCHLELLCWKNLRSIKKTANGIGAKVKFHKTFYLIFHRNSHNNFYHLYNLREWLELNENRQDAPTINNTFYKK